MARYIDADEVLESEFTIEQDGAIACVVDSEVIRRALTVKARPVVYGQWIHVPLNMNPDYFAYKYNLRKKCSACNYAMPEEYPNFNICPNCGADMSPKEEANED